MVERTMQEWEALLNWAEDRREIKNTMGKFVQTVLLCMDEEREKLWSTRDDICLGLNAGWYLGQEGVAAYYARKRENTLKKAAVLQKIFPQKLGGKTLEEIYGVGTLEEKPCGTPVIEVAADRKTAKGVWYSQGANTDITPKGPLAIWTWGSFAVDFVNEDGEWKIWHLQYLEDVSTPVGTSWGDPAAQDAFADLPEFAELKELKNAEPTVAVTLRETYSANRPFTKLARLPEPYTTFAETFSYGYQEV